MTLRIARLGGTAAAALTLAFGAGPAFAGSYQCNHRPVADGRKPCPDGSPPVYVADSIQSYTAHEAQPDGPAPVRPDAARGGHDPGGSAANLLGAWGTRVGGGTWTGPADRWGDATQHTSAGAMSGGLVIRPDHTFVWNSRSACPRSAGWVETGDPGKPIALRCVDGGQSKVWYVESDDRRPGQINIFDQWGVYYVGRR